MNIKVTLQKVCKAPIIFLLILFFAISFNSVEAGRSIRLRKVKTQIAPRHISISARSGNGMYARTYGYGRPIPSYSTTRKHRRYNAGKRRNGRRDNHSRTYASGYRNWLHDPRTDRSGQSKKRNELLPFLIEPPFGSNKHKRRIRPPRPNAMQRPKPPKKTNDFDEDYFFPEEAKRAETKYEFENRYPRPKKKRRPEFESNFKFENSKIPFYDEKPLGHKTKSRPSFSYSSFIQHTPEESEDFYDDIDNAYSQPVVRNKKKRVKKKSNSRKKHKEQFKPFVFENDQVSGMDHYPPYITSDEYELPTKTYKKRNKPSYDSDDDEFLPTPNYKPRPQVNPLFSADSDYKSSQKTQVQFNPGYSQSWSEPPVETTARPVTYQTENGFQPQYNPSQYNYNKDYTTVQKTKTVTTNTQATYYSPPDNSYKIPYNNYASNQVLTQPQTQNYNTFSGTYNQPSSTYSQSSPTYSQPSPTYSQPSPSYSQPSSTYSQPSPTYSQSQPSSSSVISDVTIQKSVPIYDNTETFYNFNNNAFVNSQSSKYYNSGNSSSKNHNSSGTQKYGTRLSTSSSNSYRNKLGDKTDTDSDFIKKHQNLYNNGLTGVPVQGDGYAKETTKKDYDIGYGDFQFDENPNS